MESNKTSTLTAGLGQCLPLMTALIEAIDRASDSPGRWLMRFPMLGGNPLFTAASPERSVRFILKPPPAKGEHGFDYWTDTARLDAEHTLPELVISLHPTQAALTIAELLLTVWVAGGQIPPAPVLLGDGPIAPKSTRIKVVLDHLDHILDALPAGRVKPLGKVISSTVSVKPGKARPEVTVADVVDFQTMPSKDPGGSRTAADAPTPKEPRMAITTDQVHEQAYAFLESLEKMPSKQKEAVASIAYGERFNTVLALAKEAMPDVDERLWPKPIEPNKGAGVKIATAKFVEIETYVRMIIAHLPKSYVG